MVVSRSNLAPYVSVSMLSLLIYQKPHKTEPWLLVYLKITQVELDNDLTMTCTLAQAF